ncbi:MAG: hypothetical protein CMJ75_08915 [Planctomycetaceae bacterium]|nr:hypothetical protein [Planctomycetaceae bacterium]
MSKRPPDESSASPSAAANGQPDPADATDLTSEETVEITPDDVEKTLEDASANPAISTPGHQTPPSRETASNPKVPLEQSDTDQTSTIDAPYCLAANTLIELLLRRGTRRWS